MVTDRQLEPKINEHSHQPWLLMRFRGVQRYTRNSAAGWLFTNQRMSKKEQSYGDRTEPMASA
jgi:hypothetical protein